MLRSVSPTLSVVAPGYGLHSTPNSSPTPAIPVVELLSIGIVFTVAILGAYKLTAYAQRRHQIHQALILLQRKITLERLLHKPYLPPNKPKERRLR